MTVSWYQSLIKVLLSRFPQSCRHFHNAETGTQYLVRHSPSPTCSVSPTQGACLLWLLTVSLARAVRTTWVPS